MDLEPQYIRGLRKSEARLFDTYLGQLHAHAPECIRTGVYRIGDRLVALINKGPFGVYRYPINRE
jgi:hypothetical protein